MKKLIKCLACNSKKLLPLIDLGKQPLANSYSSKEVYPLAVNYCENCHHAQLTHSVDPKILYTNYAYVSGTTSTLNQWFKRFADRFELEPKGRILDIAGNDGSLLKHFKSMGWEVLNIDPAKNLNKFNQEQGIEIVNDFWSEKISKKYGKFDVITAFNVIAHNPNPLDMIKGIKNALRDSGRAFIMTSQMNMLQTGQFDTIYHEHHSYFTPNSMMALLHRAGFEKYITETSVEPIHGESMLVEIHKPYINFSRQTDKAMEFLRSIPQESVGYGAAAKATVMINACNIPVKYVADENPLKQGKFVPGTAIPIVNPSKLKEEKKSLDIIIFAWNFADEIIGKIKKMRPNKKDKFYLPFPYQKIIES